MSTRSRASLIRHLALQFAMGAMLGMVLALSILASDARHVYAMIANAPTPELTLIVFACSFTSIFGVGAALTGFFFIMAG